MGPRTGCTSLKDGAEGITPVKAKRAPAAWRDRQARGAGVAVPVRRIAARSRPPPLPVAYGLWRAALTGVIPGGYLFQGGTHHVR